MARRVRRTRTPAFGSTRTASRRARTLAPDAARPARAPRERARGGGDRHVRRGPRARADRGEPGTARGVASPLARIAGAITRSLLRHARGARPDRAARAARSAWRYRRAHRAASSPPRSRAIARCDGESEIRRSRSWGADGGEWSIARSRRRRGRRAVDVAPATHIDGCARGRRGRARARAAGAARSTRRSAPSRSSRTIRLQRRHRRVPHAEGRSSSTRRSWKAAAPRRRRRARSRRSAPDRDRARGAQRRAARALRGRGRRAFALDRGFARAADDEMTITGRAREVEELTKRSETPRAWTGGGHVGRRHRRRGRARRARHGRVAATSTGGRMNKRARSRRRLADLRRGHLRRRRARAPARTPATAKRSCASASRRRRASGCAPACTPRTSRARRCSSATSRRGHGRHHPRRSRRAPRLARTTRTMTVGRRWPPEWDDAPRRRSLNASRGVTCRFSGSERSPRLAVDRVLQTAAHRASRASRASP